MNFVADESCAMPVIQALRQAGHDVVAIAEVAAGASDDQVLQRALQDNRVPSLKTAILASWFKNVPDFTQQLPATAQRGHPPPATRPNPRVARDIKGEVGANPISERAPIVVMKEFDPRWPPTSGRGLRRYALGR